MADRRLVWNQLTAPDLSAASAAIARANQSFNSGFDTGGGILAKYGDAQKAKADAEVYQELAGLSSEEEFNSWLQNGGINGRNVSDNLLNDLHGFRTGQIADANTRDIITDRGFRRGIAANADSRAAAAEDRAATEFGWRSQAYNDAQARDAWLRDNSGSFLNSEINGNNNGTAFSRAINRNESGGGGDQYDTLYGHRNRQNGVRVSQMSLGDVMQFSSPSGAYGQSVNNEIGRVATPMGKYQIVGSTLRRIVNDLGLPSDIPFSPAVQEQMGLYLAQQRVTGPRSRESMREGLRNEWEGFANLSNEELDTIIDEVRAQPLVSRESIMAAASGSPAPQTQGNQTVQGMGGDDFAASMAASGLFTPNQILGQVDPLRKAARAGDARQEEYRQQEQEDVLAGYLRQGMENPEVNDLNSLQANVEGALRADGRYSESEALALAQEAAGMVANSPGLSSRLAPDAPDPALAAAVDNTIADATRRFEGDDQNRSLADISRFEEDPYGTLETELGIGSDDQTRGDYDPNNLRNLVNEYADKYNVPPSVAAVAMRDVFKRDPGDDGPWWTGDFDFTRNTLRNRFNEQEVADQIARNLNPDARQRYDRDRTALELGASQLRTMQTQASQLRSQIAKTEEGSPQRRALEAQLRTLEQQMAQVDLGNRNGIDASAAIAAAAGQ